MDVRQENRAEVAPEPGALRAWFARVRLRQWFHLLPLPLATFDPHGPRGEALFAAARGVGIAFAILAFGYLLNSVADRRMDLDSRKNPFIVSGAAEHRYSLAALIALALCLAALGPWPAQLATISCLTFGWVYSTGPRIKSIPFVGTVANLGNFMPLLFVGMRTASLPPGFAWVALAFAALLLQNQLIHEAGDAVEDRRGGVRTTWLTLGLGRSTLIAAFLGLGASALAVGLAPSSAWSGLLIAVAVVFGAAFPLLLAVRGSDIGRAKRLRVTHRWCALACGAALFFVWRWTS